MRLLFGLEAQPAGGGARSDDDGAGLDPFAFDIEAEGVDGEIGVEDGAVEVLGAEVLGLLLHVLDEVGAIDAFGEAGEVFDECSEGKLAAGFVAADDEGFEIGAGGVDGGGIAGATGPYNNDVSHRNGG